MLTQTIALFRYQLLGMINARIIVLLLAIYALAFLGSRFVAELAIINSEVIALSVLAEFLRYSLVLLLIISLSHQISQDYELSQFERLLAMPISRYQYILAQFFLLMVLASILVTPVFLLMFVLGDASIAAYWTLSLAIELTLVGFFALLAVISLEKLPVAIIFTIAIYLLSKTAPVIDLILSQASPIYEEEQGFQLAQWLFGMIQYVLPGAQAFAQNNVVFGGMAIGEPLVQQLMAVLVYSLFILFVVLIDFYRKEFNQT